MKENFEKSLSILLKHEGGFVDHPKDPGGATNKGITKKTYEQFLGRDVTVEEIKNIPDEDVELIYKTLYWDVVKCDKLPAGVDFAVFDWCVNGGPSRAAKTLQKALNVDVDGAIGPNTLSTATSADSTQTIELFTKEREDFYRGLKTFDTFGKGWIRRNNETCEFAISLTKK
jgi:lysozyme family protein|tara:strand:+ start:1162 stop:1677 length:516 start_codon:yes stop_codon:yes gene_type:complete